LTDHLVSYTDVVPSDQSSAADARLRPSKKDVLTEFRRAEILAAARRVFATRGFAAATMDDIAREAGIAKGTIYLYYRSKGDVYSEAARQGLLELHEQVIANVRAARTAHDKVRAYIETKARYFERHVDFFRIYYAELHKLAEHSSQVHCDHERLHLEQVALLESELAREFPDRTDLHSVALGISALSYGVVNRRLRGWSNSSLETDIDAVVRFAWLGVAGV
jgi:AcrR family transcriptional regulator